MWQKNLKLWVCSMQSIVVHNTTPHNFYGFLNAFLVQNLISEQKLKIRLTNICFVIKGAFVWYWVFNKSTLNIILVCAGVYNKVKISIARLTFKIRRRRACYSEKGTSVVSLCFGAMPPKAVFQNVFNYFEDYLCSLLL